MEKRIPKESTVDELALVKSSAWAWFERGSKSDRSSIREFDVSRAKIDPKPSRYKLEAMKNIQEASNLPSTLKMASPRSNKHTSRASISLLDKYEIERISRQLHTYMESSYAKHHGREEDSGGSQEAEMGVEKIKKKVPKGFWLRHGVVCGSSSKDVVESTSLEYYSWRRQRPERGGAVAVVEFVGCRPRWGIRG